MDIQQILAATSSQASASKGAKEGAAGALTGADFAQALASLSSATGAEEVQGTPTEASPQASLEALRRAVTALEDSGQAIPDELQALLSRADDSEAVAQRLQALLSSTAEENTLPEGLQNLLSGASSVSLSQAMQAHPAMDSGDEAASPEMAAELQMVMQRLALIQGAGQPLFESRGATPATALPASAAALAPSSLSSLDLAAAQPGGQAAANASAPVTSNPLLQAAQARIDAPAITATALASAEATQQASGGQGTATAAPAASPQALLEALAARREPQSGSGQGHHPSPMAGPLSGSGQATSMTPPGNVSAPATPQQATLSAPVDSPAWPRQLGQQLIRFGRGGGGGEQHIEMKLHPAELGPLSVTLKVGDQGAQAHFLSAHAQVRQTLEQALPQLREALAEQGIALGETSVGEQRQGDADGQQFASTGGSSSSEDDEPALAPQVSDSARGRDIPLDGRVDLYA
ncbi:flagellar hook-length control protein FliK [Halomonas sp. THAF12]|uniref:flagellar hook-length control protein FliK n=1 Tax=Halomonas sp. B23F22_10 TaxID=3459515 RepID=UPI00373EEFD5